MEEKKLFLKGLEKDHESIVKLFNGLEPVLKNGNISDVSSILKTINRFNNTLVKHLKDEDEIFYPDLRKRAVELKQDALLPALDVFIEDMNKISRKVFDFFSRYRSESDIATDEKGFIKDIAEIRDALVKRINTEEETLYYIYKAYYGI